MSQHRGSVSITPCRLDQTAYAALRQGAVVLEQDGYGDKVLRLRDGRILKLFRRKRLLSSALWLPYAVRFARNAARLAEYGIPCPVVEAVYRIASVRRDAVLYQPLPGITLRAWIRQPHTADDTLYMKHQVRAFIAHLHQLGVYFRSLHMGNVILTPQGQLGLIDIADLRFFPAALNEKLCMRNLRKLSRYPEEKAWLETADRQNDIPQPHSSGKS